MSARIRQWLALVITTAIEPFYMLLDGITEIADWIYPAEGEDE